ncbi:MAG: M14-type cytosolic carboxypeptidase [Rhodocyclaceae bacterium]
MTISSHFDAGAIDVLGTADPREIQLDLRRDNAADFRQWFYFRLQGARGTTCRLRFVNAGQSAYPEGWRDYRAVASYDRRHWFRLADTSYDGETLSVVVAPERDSIYLAYFEPYSWERHLDLLGRVETVPGVGVVTLGRTVEGRELDLVTIGEPGDDRSNVWIIARQHPGETMAQWLVEGFLERLLDPADPVGRRVRELAVIHVVPNMNPDGAVGGNLRTNAAGANLNREWLAPSMERSPEVLLTRQKMHQTGVDLFLDIHGDESLPYVFIDGSSMVPGFTPAQRRAEERFLDALRAASPDFQTERGYAANRFSDEMLTLASKYVAHTFGCVSLTLEMPFKDNANLPDPTHGWSAARSKRLGAALLQPALAHLQQT